MRTAKAIADLKGDIILETNQEIFEGMLDSEGRYEPPKYER